MEVAWCSDHGLPHSALLRWSDEDRAKLVAHLLEVASRCQMCGTAAWEWEADSGAYEAGAEICRGCMIKETASEETRNERMPGQRITLVPRKTAERNRARREAARARAGRR